jgi:hypothetical protein
VRIQTEAFRALRRLATRRPRAPPPPVAAAARPTPNTTLSPPRPRPTDYTRGIAAKHIKRGYTLMCQWAGPALLLPVAASFGVSSGDARRRAHPRRRRARQPVGGAVCRLTGGSPGAHVRGQDVPAQRAPARTLAAARGRALHPLHSHAASPRGRALPKPN